MVNSRQKGKRGELQARDQVREHWDAPDCIRAAQSNGKWSCDLLYAMPYAHIEVKSVARIGALRFLEQAERDAPNGYLPVVLMREKGRKEYVVMFTISGSREFAEGMRQNGI